MCSVRLLLAGCCLSLLGACDSGPRTPHNLPPDTVATVNGRPISAPFLKRYIAERLYKRPNSNQASERERIIDEAINIELILQDAEQSGYAEQAQVKIELLFLHKKLLNRMMLAHTLGQIDVSDAVLKKQYAAVVLNPPTQYQARHILVASREKALVLIKKLKKGAHFDVLAKQHSLDATAKKGGQLGWFKAANMAPAFVNAVTQMRKGTFTVTPVQSQFGWHVILLENSQASIPASFEAMREELMQQVRQAAVNRYLARLKQQASIRKY